MVAVANALHALESPLGGHRFNVLPLDAHAVSKSSRITAKIAEGGTPFLSFEGTGIEGRDSSSSGEGESEGGNGAQNDEDDEATSEARILEDLSGESINKQNDEKATLKRAAVAAPEDDDIVKSSDEFTPFPAPNLQDSVLSIEVQFRPEHGLVKVFFPRPAVCGFLTEQQQTFAREKLDFTLDEAQVLREFFRLTDGITDEIRHRCYLAEMSFVGAFLKVT
eukprot:CAMPEP_0171805808 /NCGR_PEP_ID=MMETSP0991-20121206/74941_1 /TAXON_ID=483369 /ORGANISM="non described non described, Strain CCMP2098" /LENGTH=221 /DNA_ID=CAMNT_0012418471 /DNA_START=111 /DNA_END=774 /DNA_ORIENTATION=+